MSGYIDKDFVIKRIHETMDMQDLYLPAHFIQLLNEPPVYELIKDGDNIVEIVRCKDCKYSHLTYDKEAKYCDQWETGEALYLDGDFYCAFGEKKVTE